VTDFEYGNS
jgi:hypothetical protein